jgi:TP901 family phage tail tape measure protein
MARSRIAEAYVQIVPVLDGIGKNLGTELSKTLGGAGNAGGEDLAKGVAGGFGGKIKGLIGPAIAAIGGAIAVGAFAGFLKEGVAGAEELNLKLREVVTLTGQTGAEADKTFKEMASLVKGVSSEFGIAQDVLTGGLYSALSAGVPKENAMTFLQVASKAAIGGVTDVETAVDGITTVINAFGLSAEDAERVSDSLFTAVKGGKTTFGELSASLFNVGPAAAAAGVSFEEVNASIAALTAAGTPTSVATTQIRAALVGLQRPSADLNKIFQDLGYENAQLAIESEGLQFALNAVKDASGGSNGQLQQLLGSVEAVAAVNVLAGTGAEKFTAELEAQTAAAGATTAAFDEVDKSRNSERLRIAMENLSISLGTLLLPAIEEVAAFMQDYLLPVFENQISPAIQAFSAFLKDNVVPVIRDQVIPAFQAIFGFIRDNLPTILTFIGVLTALTVVYKAAAIAAGVVRAATAAWAVVQGILNAVLAANPIGLIIIAVAALVAGIVFLATRTQFFQKVWGAMVDFAQRVFAGFAQFFSDLTGGMRVAWTLLVSQLRDVWNNVITFFRNAWDGFLQFFRNVGTAIGNFFSGVAAFLVSIWDGWVNGVRTGIQLIRTIFETVMNGVTSFFRNVVNGWINIAESFVNFFIRGINTIIRGLNSIKVSIPSFVPGVGGQSFGINLAQVAELRLPRLAKGGFVDRPTTALIGEAGPEVVTPLKDFERMMGLDGNSGQTINYYAAPNESLDSERALITAMQRARIFA